MSDTVRATIDFTELLSAAINAKKKQELKVELKALEEIEQTPEGEYLSWETTPEQIARINAGDRVALDEFYFDNYNRIKFSALRYVRNNSYIISVASWEDLAQQVYCDLRTGFIKLRPYNKAISESIWKSFRYAPVGGLDEVFIPREKGGKACQKQVN